jgi:hypothetical protein
MKVTGILVSLLLLSGCESTGKMLENRLSCTLSGDTAYVTSMYGPIGVTNKIAEADARVACKPESRVPEAK